MVDDREMDGPSATGESASCLPGKVQEQCKALWATSLGLGCYISLTELCPNEPRELRESAIGIVCESRKRIGGILPLRLARSRRWARHPPGVCHVRAV